MLVIFLMVPRFVSADNPNIIFEDNFDSTPDWHAMKAFDQGMNDNGGCVAGVDANYCAVPNWTSWGDDEIWNPYDNVKARPESRPGLEISNFAHYGSSGKSLIITNEHFIGTGYDGWGSNTILSKDLDQDYKELYMQFKIMYQPGWTWNYKVGYMGAQVKTFRWVHWNRTDGCSAMPTSGGPGSGCSGTGSNGNAPLFVLDAGENEYGGGLGDHFRCSPSVSMEVNYNGTTYTSIASNVASSSNLPTNTAFWTPIAFDASQPQWIFGNEYSPSNYFCNVALARAAGTSQTDMYSTTNRYEDYAGAKVVNAQGVQSSTLDSVFSDGNWHTITMHVKINTNTQTPDGVYELWQDGHLLYSQYNLLYNDLGGDSNAGINGIMLGGNNWSNYPEISNTPNNVDEEKLYRAGTGAASPVREEWYAIDDVIASTTPIPDGYVIGGGSTDTLAPAAPSGLSVN